MCRSNDRILGRVGMPNDRILGSVGMPNDQVLGSVGVPNDRILGSVSVQNDQVLGSVGVQNDRVLSSAGVQNDRVLGSAGVPNDLVPSTYKVPFRPKCSGRVFSFPLQPRDQQTIQRRSGKEVESRQSLHGHLFSQSLPRSGWVLTAGLPSQRNGKCLLCGEPSFDGPMEEAKERYNG